MSSTLRNAACVILATATMCFGGWTETWPATESSYPSTTADAIATPRNKDLWLAWQERYRAWGRFGVDDVQSQSGSVVFWTDTTNVISGGYTNTYPVYVTNTWSTADADWPAGWGKFRMIAGVMGPGPSPGADGGEWVEPWSMSDINQFAASNGALPLLSLDRLGIDYPPMIVNAAATTNDRNWTWLVPEFDYSPVKANPSVIMSGYQSSNAWVTDWIPTVTGDVSKEPYIRFWNQRTNGYAGTFSVSGYVLDATNYAYHSYTQSVAVSTNPAQLSHWFAGISAATASGASTGLTCTIYRGTNATRSRVPLIAGGVSRTWFNSEYHRAHQYRNVKFPADAWIASNEVVASTYVGAAVVEGSNDTIAARSDAFYAMALTEATTNFLGEYVVTDPESGAAWTNKWINSAGAPEPGHPSAIGGSAQAEYDNQTLVTYDYVEETNVLTWVVGSMYGVSFSNSYFNQAPDSTNDTRTTNFNHWTGCRLTSIQPGENIYARAWPTFEAYTGLWYSVRSVEHAAYYFYAVEANPSNHPFAAGLITPYQLQSTVTAADGFEQYVNSGQPLTGAGWAPTLAEFPTNSSTAVWSIPKIDCVYSYKYDRD